MTALGKRYIAVQFGDSRLPESFWRRVIPEPNSGCWLWIGRNNGDRLYPYGRIAADYETDYTHRVSYRTLVGEIKSGLVIDHLCRTTLCCNPLHLEPVTIAENIRRGNSLITHCPAGHAYTAKSIASELRKCRTCNDAINKRRKARLLAAGICTGGEGHGKATHGRLCASCKAKRDVRNRRRYAPSDANGKLREQAAEVRR